MRPGVLMKPRVLALLIFSTALPFASGCAADEIDSRGAAFPEPIGYTPPPSTARPPVAAVSAPDASGASSSDEVVVGEDDDGLASRGQAVDGSGAEDPGLESGGTNGPGAPGRGAEDTEAERQGAEDTGAEGQVADANADAYADDDPSALSDFRAPLDPYGAWTEDPTYGTVWVPSPDVVGDDFTPYVTGGHWAYDDEYVWVSDYDWGWAPFHYGRWTRGERLGWEWIPGRRYAGAWVSWRYGERGSPYVGWAPRAPSWGWRDGMAVRLGSVPSSPYSFVGTRDLFGPSLGSRVVAGSAAAGLVAHTRPWAIPSSGGLGGAPRGQSGGEGPPPSALNMPSSAIAHSAGDRGILQAEAFGRPSTAVALGARAPQRSATGDGWAGSRRASTTLGRTFPSRYAATSPSHFGGRFGAGFTGSPGAEAPMMRSPSYSQGGRAYSGTPSFPSSTYRTPGGGYGRSRDGSGGYYRSPGASVGWGTRPGGGAMGHGSAAPFHGNGTGGFHGGGGGGGSHGGSAGGGGFHGGGGGGGGFHGGGGNRGGGGRR
jgi:hypothetical protein